MRGGKAESFEVEHAQGVDHGLGAGARVEMIAREFAYEPVGGKRVERVERSLVVRCGLPAFAFSLDEQ